MQIKKKAQKHMEEMLILKKKSKYSNFHEGINRLGRKLAWLPSKNSKINILLNRWFKALSLLASSFSPQFRTILLSPLPVESIHLAHPLFSASLSLSSVSFLPFTPSVSPSLPSAFQNEGAKLLFPSHYLICASPLGCKSSRYSSQILH